MAEDKAQAAPEFKPYVPADAQVAELTPRAIVLGMLFGVIFGAVTVYVGLRAGLTVSASIPIAVLSITPPAGPGPRDDPREQHRPDHGLGRGVGGRRRHLHPARPSSSWASTWSTGASSSWR